MVGARRDKKVVCRMSNYGSDSLSGLRNALHGRAPKDDWVWLHRPKNLAQALTVGAAKVLEAFQWRADSEASALSRKARARIADEMADVLVYLVLLADKLDVDLSRVAWKKLTANPEKHAAGRRCSNVLDCTKL